MLVAHAVSLIGSARQACLDLVRVHPCNPHQPNSTAILIEMPVRNYVMAAPIKKVLVIGGGFSGMSAAIALRKKNIEVDLIEIDPFWRSHGTGMNMGGASMRVFRDLGVLEAFLEKGAVADGVELFTSAGKKISTLATPRIAGLDVPGNGAIRWSVLADIFATATRQSGTNVRLGCSFVSIENGCSATTVVFTDGSCDRYVLVIGADGMDSVVRQTLFPDAPKPQYMGWRMWRASVPRTSGVITTSLWFGKGCNVGLTPVSRDEMYLFVTEYRDADDVVDPADVLSTLQDLLTGFSAPALHGVHEHLKNGLPIMYCPIQGLLLPNPWYRGPVVLIGDTVHPTAPDLAGSTCIGIEDAVVLAEEIRNAGSVDQALDRYQTRRFERCRMLMQKSVCRANASTSSVNKCESAHYVRETLMELAQPI
jgi:2-polyprenyl-6-methoxyphenol hydroxylase-like FAD-dependent oxidoreductase